MNLNGVIAVMVFLYKDLYSMPDDVFDAVVFGNIAFADVSFSYQQQEDERYYRVTHWAVIEFPVQHSVIPSPLGGYTYTVQQAAVAMTENGVQVLLP